MSHRARFDATTVVVFLCILLVGLATAFAMGGKQYYADEEEFDVSAPRRCSAAPLCRADEPSLCPPPTLTGHLQGPLEHHLDRDRGGSPREHACELCSPHVKKRTPVAFDELTLPLTCSCCTHCHYCKM